MTLIILFRKYSNYKIILSIPPIGCEELIVELAQVHKLKISIPSLQFKLLKELQLLHNIQIEKNNVQIIVKCGINEISSIERLIYDFENLILFYIL